MRSRFVFGGLAVAAITALGGLSVVGLASSASAAVTIPAKPYDFNGDGFVDEAIGSPYGTVSGHQYAGFVNVIYGSSAGLNTGKHQVFSQNSANVPGAAETSDHFGYSLASGDFDRDGYADLAIGVPDEDTGDGANAGLIEYLAGSPSGLVPVTVADAEPETPGAGHRFGESLSFGDIERDGSPELFFTMPGTSQFWAFSFTAATAPAAKTSATGSLRHAVASKLSSASVTSSRSAKARVGTLSAADVNNSWLALGDVTGDGFEDVVYAWNDADFPDPAFRHGFLAYPGSADGSLAEPVEIDVDVNSVTVGDFDANGFADVAVGQTPDKDHLGGQVRVFTGSATNVAPAASYAVHQETPAVPGAGEAGDAFGASVAAGDINKDGKADLVAGAPTEDVGTIADAGATFVLLGSATGLTGTGSQVITQDTAGVPGGCEKGDKLGTQVTLLDNNKDGLADLTAGAPVENAGDGMISWLKGTATGLTGTGSLGIGSGTFGVTGKKAEIGRRLGRLG